MTYAVVLRHYGVVGVVALGVLSGILWLWSETPHPAAAMASRESTLTEARSMRPLLETTEVQRMAAFAMHKRDAVTKEEPPSTQVGPTTPPPVWFVADDAETIERLRQMLRERGARRMGTAVRFAMLNLAELFGMTESAWAASMATPAASENEASAWLLTFYLRHLDRAGDGAGVRALQQALRANMPQARAVEQSILAGRTVSELEAEMRRLYLRVGIDLQFTRRGGAVFHP